MSHEETLDSEYSATVSDLARVAEEDGLDAETLGDILRRRHGAVNCYPGEPTDACHPVAWFIALEGRLGRRLTHEYGPFWRRHGWLGGPWIDWDYPPQPRYGFVAMLENCVRHMQGHCAGITRTAIIVTDSWNAPAYEHWRANIGRMRAEARVEIHLIGAGAWQRRVF